MILNNTKYPRGGLIALSGSMVDFLVSNGLDPLDPLLRKSPPPKSDGES